MSNLKLKVSTSFIGTTGFNNHAQSFFRALSRKIPLEIRNFTVGRSWSHMSDEPHNGEPYMDDELKKLLVQQSLWVADGKLEDFDMYTKWPNPGVPNVSLILNDTDHHYFYQEYPGYKIAYNVWEAIRQPEGFFNKLLEFDEFWVPSKWQRDCSIQQGYPADKIFVIPEGVDDTVFFPENVKSDLISPDKFTFALMGRWDYRKSTLEVIKAFVDEFKNDDGVEMILSVDNPFSNDGMSSTEERLAHYGLEDPKLKIVHLPPREEYVKLMKAADVFVSCARSEGWNLPLIEAMACGVPSIYSNCSGQLEFAEGRGIPVRVLGEEPVTKNPYNHFNPHIGNYYAPDFNDLRRAMRDAYVNWAEHKKRALRESSEIRTLFNWDRIAQLTAIHLRNRESIIDRVNQTEAKPLTINYNFIKGAYLEILGGEPGQFKAEFIDRKTGETKHEPTIFNNMWTRTAIQYYTDWQMKVTEKMTGVEVFNESIDLKDQRVYIALESSSLGDTLAWFPAAEEFRKKHECKVICSTFMNDLFKKTYPEIEFITPGEGVSDIAAMYSLGWYYDETGQIKKSQNPFETKSQPMQKSAFDILGLEWTETKPKLELPDLKRTNKISIGIHATCQAKYWNNPTGWQEVVDWCNKNGYEVVLLSKEESGFMGNPHPTGVRKLPNGPLSKVIEELRSSAAFIGIGSGLSWLSWATDTPTVLISGFSEDYTETLQNTFAVRAPKGKCSGCFNRVKLDPSDWNWCPDHKGTDRMFECSKEITSAQVIETLQRALGLI